jgi:hypothetical protein
MWRAGGDPAAADVRRGGQKEYSPSLDPYIGVEAQPIAKC